MLSPSWCPSWCAETCPGPVSGHVSRRYSVPRSVPNSLNSCHGRSSIHSCQITEVPVARGKSRNPRVSNNSVWFRSPYLRNRRPRVHSLWSWPFPASYSTLYSSTNGRIPDRALRPLQPDHVSGRKKDDAFLARDLQDRGSVVLLPALFAARDRLHVAPGRNRGVP